MSIAYFMAFEKKLKEKDFVYKDIIRNYNLNFGNGDGILFEEHLSESEKTAVGSLFQQREVYSLKANIPLEFKESDKVLLSEDYFHAAKEQILWLIDFIKKQLKKSHEVFFIRLSLGHKINYGKILSQYVDVDTFIIPQTNFVFEPGVIYQFVDNSPEHIEWMKNHP